MDNNQPNMQMINPNMQMQQMVQHIQARLAYDEKIESQPDSLDRMEEFYNKAYQLCENLFKNDQISVFNTSPTFFPSVNSCFLIKKKDNKTRDILHNMSVSYQDAPKRQTVSFKYIDGKTPNEIKVRIVEAHNINLLSKIGVTKIKSYYLVHSYYSRQSTFYNEQDFKDQLNTFNSNVPNQMDKGNCMDFNNNAKQSKHLPQVIVASNNQNINNNGLNMQQIGLGDQEIRLLQGVQYPNQLFVGFQNSNNSNHEIRINCQQDVINQNRSIQEKNQYLNQNQIQQNKQQKQFQQNEVNSQIEQPQQNKNNEQLENYINQIAERLKYLDETVQNLQNLQNELKEKDIKIKELEKKNDDLYQNQQIQQEQINSLKLLITNSNQIQQNQNASQISQSYQNIYQYDEEFISNIFALPNFNHTSFQNQNCEIENNKKLLARSSSQIAQNEINDEIKKKAKIDESLKKIFQFKQQDQNESSSDDNDDDEVDDGNGNVDDNDDEIDDGNGEDNDNEEDESDDDEDNEDDNNNENEQNPEIQSYSYQTITQQQQIQNK